MGFFLGLKETHGGGAASYTVVLRARGLSSPDSFQDESAAVSMEDVRMVTEELMSD